MKGSPILTCNRQVNQPMLYPAQVFGCNYVYPLTLSKSNPTPQSNPTWLECQRSMQNAGTPPSATLQECHATPLWQC